MSTVVLERFQASINYFRKADVMQFLINPICFCIVSGTKETPIGSQTQYTFDRFLSLTGELFCCVSFFVVQNVITLQPVDMNLFLFTST